MSAITIEGLVLVIDTSAAGVGTVDNFVQLLKTNGPISGAADAVNIVASLSLKNPALSIFSNTMALTLTLVKAGQHTTNGEPVTLGEVVSAIGNVVGIVGGLLALTSPLGWTAIGISVAGATLTGIGATLNLQAMNNVQISSSIEASFATAEATVSPLVLDLDGNGVDTLNKTTGIHFDHDGNGFAETTGWVGKRELLTLDAAGVLSLSTSFTSQTVLDAQNNKHLQAGQYTRLDGSTQAMDDVWFAMDTTQTIDQDLVAVSDEIAALPDLQAFGNVHSLHQAMARDTTGRLQSLLTSFLAASDADTRHSIMTTLLYAWAGVENIDPNSRADNRYYGNVIGDARKLATLECFLGESYLGTWCLKNHPTKNSAITLH